jgi:hypothetical protein
VQRRKSTHFSPLALKYQKGGSKVEWQMKATRQWVRRRIGILGIIFFLAFIFTFVFDTSQTYL